jgi:hypothetical protein
MSRVTVQLRALEDPRCLTDGTFAGFRTLAFDTKLTRPAGCTTGTAVLGIAQDADALSVTAAPPGAADIIAASLLAHVPRLARVIADAAMRGIRL